MLASLSVAARIYAGFAVVLALLGGLAAYTAVSTQQAEAVVRAYGATTAQTLFVADGVDDYANVRIGRIIYALNGSDTARQQVLSLLDRLQADIAASGAVFPGDEGAAKREALAAINAMLGEFRGMFVGYVADVGEVATMLGSLRDLGGELGERLGKIMDGAFADGETDVAYHAGVAQRELLLARYAAYMFLQAGDPRHWDTAAARLATARERADTLAARPGNLNRKILSQETAALMADYARGLTASRDVVLRREAASAALLNDLGPRLFTAFRDLQAKVVERQKQISAEALADLAATHAVSIWAGVGAFLVGAALAGVIGLWIARSISSMAAAMGRLAEGDLDIAVTDDEHRHELGRMAQALKVFQTNGREMRRLAAEQKAAADRDLAAAAERAALQSAVAAAVDRAAAGDFAARVEARYQDEALNGFARQLNGLMETVGAGVGETATVMAALARGDLTAAMAGAFRGAFAELQSNVNGAVERMRDTVIDIQTVAGTMARSTGEIASGATDLAGRAENQAASLEQIAATMEQMATTVKTNADNAATATQLGAEATSRADRGGKVVADAVTAMSQIAEGSRKIADIVSVIDGFAFQTNLLALNAAVEAARAGEAGKGFAVVASEVRTLAQRSAEAARDIKALIDASATSVKDGVRLVEETGAALREIVEAIRKTSTTIEDISQASREQSSGVDEISAAIASMDQITQQNSALAEESASAAKGLAGQAARLTELTAFFTVAARAGARRDPSLAAFAADAAADRAPAGAPARARARG
jgi:methyl-accepting chemotaxis protein